MTPAAHTAAAWLYLPTVTRSIDRASGSVFVALGPMTIVPVLPSWV